MAVTKASKEAELQELEGAFKGTESAILVDYRGLKVPEVTELRRQVRGVQGRYKVIKNTLATRAVKGTAFEPLTEHFVGTTAVAYSGDDPVALAKVLTTFAKTAPALQDQGGGRPGAVDQGRRGHRARVAAREAGALREAPVPAAGADGADRQRAQRRAARPDERAGAGGKEARRSRHRRRKLSALSFQPPAALAWQTS